MGSKYINLFRTGEPSLPALALLERSIQSHRKWQVKDSPKCFHCLASRVRLFGNKYINLCRVGYLNLPALDQFYHKWQVKDCPKYRRYLANRPARLLCIGSKCLGLFKISQPSLRALG